MTEINHEYTQEIVCPHCGYADRDSWEVEPNDDEMNCGRCDKEFYYERHIDVTYSTQKIKGET
jgi:hypothetical protein